MSSSGQLALQLLTRTVFTTLFKIQRQAADRGQVNFVSRVARQVNLTTNDIAAIEIGSLAVSFFAAVQQIWPMFVLAD
ncbi:hypothetical protein OH492_19355 [Vibrio chagasii]|nr:hypothetical protein [Vibrio chagasii]